jgi:predicted ribosomally synthesized peptide with SipW-like signal peptide
MRKWKNLKLKAIIAAVSLSGALIAGSTLAWFTDTTEADPVTFKAGTVEIEAGRTVNVPGDTLYYEEMPYTVADYLQGEVDRDARKAETAENVLYRISSRSTGSQQPADTEFYSMSKSGWLVIKLDKPLSVGDGIRVIECTGGTVGSGASYPEYAEVWVGNSYNGSMDGFVYVGDVSNVNGVPYGTALYDTKLMIDDSVVDFDINYIYLKDKSPNKDGYDIDYLGVVIMNEGNWNPGDINYIAYRVDNVGTKAIRLRAALSGVWQSYDEEQGIWVPDTTLETDNVVISLTADNGGKWTLGDDGYYYYNGAINGTYSGNAESATLYLSVHLKGLETGNEYQGKRFVITPTFQAIQNSHQGEWNWAEFDSYN